METHFSKMMQTRFSGTFQTTVFLCPLSSLIKLVFHSVPLLSQSALPHVNPRFSCKITKCSKLFFDWDRPKGESPPSCPSLASTKPFSKAQETITISPGRQSTQSSWTGEASISVPLTIGPRSPAEQGLLTRGPVPYCWSTSCCWHTPRHARKSRARVRNFL